MQTDLDFNKPQSLQERGMAEAIAHADATSNNWSERALQALKHYLQYHPGEFMGEDFRVYAQQRGLPEPPNLRAYGAVIVRAAREGLIVQRGVRRLQNPRAHRCYANTWVRRAS